MLLQFRSSSRNSGKHRMAASAKKTFGFLSRSSRSYLFFPVSTSILYHNLGYGFGFLSNQLSLQVCSLAIAELATHTAGSTTGLHSGCRLQPALQATGATGRQNEEEWTYSSCAGRPSIWFLSLAGLPSTQFSKLFFAFSRGVLCLSRRVSHRARSLILSLSD